MADLYPPQQRSLTPEEWGRNFPLTAGLWKGPSGITVQSDPELTGSGTSGWTRWKTEPNLMHVTPEVYAGNKPTTITHEISHMFGSEDYADPVQSSYGIANAIQNVASRNQPGYVETPEKRNATIASLRYMQHLKNAQFQAQGQQALTNGGYTPTYTQALKGLWLKALRGAGVH